MKIFALAVYSLVVLSCSAQTLTGGTVACMGIPDVTVLTGADNCAANGQIYSNFSVGSNGFNSFQIGLLDEVPDGSYTNLQFLVTQDPNPITTPGGFARMWYEDSAPTGALIDSAKMLNIDGAGMILLETACASSFADNYGECPTADLLGYGAARMGFESDIEFSRPVDHVYLRKVFQFDDASITRFDNGTDLVTPEPVTTGLVGLGLIGMAVWIKRSRP